MESDTHQDEWSSVGERLRAAREKRAISVRELARRIKVSPSHISQVERGLASFSVQALYAVTQELDLSMDSLFESDALPLAESTPIPTAPADMSLESSGVVLRRAKRPTLQLSDGPRWERLTARPEPLTEFIEVIYPPASAVANLPGFARHSGREWGLVSAGRLNVQVGFAEAVLEQGDSIVFDCGIPHRFWNSSAEEVRAVWFIDSAVAGSSEAEPPPTSRHH